MNGRESIGVKLEDFLDKPIIATGADIVEGSYPGTLFAYSAPFKVPNNFAKEGEPTTRVVFEMRFGIFDKKGGLAEVTRLLPTPENGKLNRRSNAYKAAAALCAGDATMMKGEDFTSEFSFAKLIGKNAVLAVSKNAKDFPQVDAVGAKMAGAKYPSLEDCKKMLGGSGHIPF